MDIIKVLVGIKLLLQMPGCISRIYISKKRRLRISTTHHLLLTHAEKYYEKHKYPLYHLRMSVFTDFSWPYRKDTNQGESLWELHTTFKHTLKVMKKRDENNSKLKEWHASSANAFILALKKTINGMMIFCVNQSTKINFPLYTSNDMLHDWK